MATRGPPGVRPPGGMRPCGGGAPPAGRRVLVVVPGGVTTVVLLRVPAGTPVERPFVRPAPVAATAPRRVAAPTGFSSWPFAERAITGSGTGAGAPTPAVAGSSAEAGSLAGSRR